MMLNDIIISTLTIIASNVITACLIQQSNKKEFDKINKKLKNSNCVIITKN